MEKFLRSKVLSCVVAVIMAVSLSGVFAYADNLPGDDASAESATETNLSTAASDEKAQAADSDDVVALEATESSDEVAPASEEEVAPMVEATNTVTGLAATPSTLKNGQQCAVKFNWGTVIGGGADLLQER